MSKIPSKQIPSSTSKVVLRTRPTTTGSQTLNPNARNSLSNALKIGDRVTSGGKAGTIAFIGTTKFADGAWIGINLDEPHGKNDGSHGGVRYFETDANHGLFCRPDSVQRLSINGALQRNSLYIPSRLSVIEDASNNISGITTIDKQDLSSTKNLQIGDRVLVRKEKYGTLKYIGKIHIDDGIWCGVQLDGPLGKHDGKIDGTRYFTCPARSGVFAPLHHVEKIVTDPKSSRKSIRESIISTDSINQYNEAESQDSRLSEFSTSSNEIDLVPTRSPKKIKQPILSPDLTPIELSLTTQIANLQETIKEKDLFIRNLQRQFEIKEKEQLELTQRVEDLQNQVSQSNLIIPDNHRLLSSDEIAIYEETKEKIVELELINEKLIQEKQMFEEELQQYNDSNTLIDELKEQIELLKAEVTDLQTKEEITATQLAEKETFYQQQIKEYQSNTNQITEDEEIDRLRLIILEEEKETNEKQINDLLNELKDYQENIIPDLEKQCEMLKSELNNRDQTVNMTLNERDTYYEQQIKEYENNLNQATRETQNIQAELAKLEQEKILNDNKSNTIINSLKEDYERQFEILKSQLTEFQDQDQTQNIILNERIAHYEIEIKEYQLKIDKDVQEIQSLLDQLQSLQEEKNAREQQLHKNIETLKNDYQELQIEIDELNKREQKAHKTLHQYEAKFEQEIRGYQEKLEQADRETQQFQSKLDKLQEENTNYNDTIKTLTQNLETLKIELQDQNRTDNKNEAHYESEIKELQANRDQSFLEIQDLESQLTNLQEEKNAMEDELNKTKQDYEKLKLETNENFQQREAQIKEYQVKSDQSDLLIQQLQSELDEVLEEKTEADETINSLTQELESLKTKLQDQDCNEDFQSKLTNLDEEKTTMETELNETIDKLKEYCEILRNKQEEKESQILKEYRSKFEQEIDECQKNLELSICQAANYQLELVNLQEEKESNEKNLNETINLLKLDFEEQIQILKTEIIELKKLDKTKEQQLKKYQSEYDQTNELTQRIENLTLLNEALKQKLEDMKHINNSTEIDELTQQVNDLQKMHSNLLEKQAIREQEYAEEKKAQENIMKEKIDEYEMKVALVKSEYAVEMENIKLDHDQEVLRLKALIPKLPPPKGKK